MHPEGESTMKAKLGIILMALGSVLVFAALGLFLVNEREQQQAQEAVAALMPQMAEVILDRRELPTLPSAQPPETTVPVEMTPPAAVTEPEKTAMPVVEIDGHDYIGFVGIPAKELELPVMSDWSYPQLKIAPCRFSGDMYTDDLVVMAHNYDRHFGVLHEFRVGERITFTDMDGETVEYTVVALDILPPTAVEEMTAGDYDLTLFTCTYGGQSRVTVRCDRVKQ